MQRWGIKSAKNHQVLRMAPPEDSLELRIRNMKSIEKQNLLTTFFFSFFLYLHKKQYKIKINNKINASCCRASTVDLYFTLTQNIKCIKVMLRIHGVNTM